ncbi:MAG: rhodanese-like domain-containing protein [Thalassobaculum sp.]|uniref:rhodanese-like domain-containing protein n=1 Tax=Thalassobaculum sp. TaxID=2022740 RepID=UPI0032F01841
MRKLIYALSLVFAIAGADAAMAATSPTEVPGATTVDAAAAKQLFDKGVPFVDVRSNADWDAGRVPGAHHLELKSGFSADTLAKVVAKDAEVVIYCNGESCLRSSEACAKAAGWGFSKLYYFRDGLPAWQSAGFPVE